VYCDILEWGGVGWGGIKLYTRLHLNYSIFLSITNDIAILRLSRDVILNENVVPACLPTDTNNKYAGQSAIVSGRHLATYTHNK